MVNPAERATITSIIMTTVFGSIEIFVALAFGSVAFFAAGIDAIFDTLTSIAVLAGLRVSRKPADKNHPYGHLQAETLVSAFLAVALVIAAIRIEFLALDKFYSQTKAEASPVLFLVAVLAISIFGALALYKIRTGRRMRASSVIADGYHTLSDAVSSSAVLVGLVFVSLGYSWVDAAVALFISLIILRWGFVIGLDALNVLMGASPGAKVVSDLKEICLGAPGVKGCHKARARRVGSRILADVHILVDPKLSVEKSHQVASRVERRLKKKMPDLNSVVVHIEPITRRNNAKKRRSG